MSTTTFRMAEASDAQALAGFMSRNFLAAYGHCSSPANIEKTIAKHYGLDAQLRQIGDDRYANLLMERDGVLAGHAQVRFGGEAPAAVEPRPGAEIGRFYVDTAFHGLGLAQQMMEKVRELSRARGARSLFLSVWQEQPQAIRFYEKEGFRIAGQLIFEVGDDPKDDWLMLAPL
jgi:ribosomal protein S18 acetylase RimI-like enzyme